MFFWFQNEAMLFELSRNLEYMNPLHLSNILDVRITYENLHVSRRNA